MGKRKKQIYYHDEVKMPTFFIIDAFTETIQKLTFLLPTISITRPGAGTYIVNNKPGIFVEVTDGDSGVSLSAFALKIDGEPNVAYNSTGVTYTAIINGYRFTYVPQTALVDVAHTKK